MDFAVAKYFVEVISQVHKEILREKVVSWNRDVSMKTAQEKYFVFFLPDTLKTAF